MSTKSDKNELMPVVTYFEPNRYNCDYRHTLAHTTTTVSQTFSEHSKRINHIATGTFLVFLEKLVRNHIQRTHTHKQQTDICKCKAYWTLRAYNTNQSKYYAHWQQKSIARLSFSLPSHTNTNALYFFFIWFVMIV